jgi:glycerol-3-phosphate dehydrogenase
MQRDLTRLSTQLHDVLVVGGGIHGACAAWEAARRGLKVALIEAGDFNGATSGNSLRTLHGGLRHLQRLDFALMRVLVRERREWLRLAPELTRPLRFVLPLSGHGARRPGVLRAALWANDLVSLDRNRSVRPDHHLHGGSILTRDEFEPLFPGIALPDHGAAAAWYDGLCLDTERLQLAVIAAAVDCGAQVANYVRAQSPLTDKGRVYGARARDELTGVGLELLAPVVINAAGPCIEEWLGESSRFVQSPLFNASKAFNLLVRKLPFSDALGLTIPSRSGADGNGGTCFIMPWNGYSLVGTRHLRCHPRTTSAEVSREEVLEFLADINPALGEHKLTADDVCGVFSGLLPEESTRTRGPEVELARNSTIVAHVELGLPGLFSIVGVKWTTARSVGERAARLACRTLGRSEQPLRKRVLNPSRVPPAHAEPSLAARVVPDMPVVLGHVAHAVREEMAMRLWDVIRRRTPLYLSRALDRPALATCASVMARELRWSRRELAAEIDATEAALTAFRGPLRAAPRPVAA